MSIRTFSIQDGNSTVVSTTSKRGQSSHNERYQDEFEWDRKVGGALYQSAALASFRSGRGGRD